ncbi:hypothetical protein BU16DRAFT_557152 [Lophium mytilinum]|uniref:C2H2-type domain-containing protein n=1 Tax=Lophium mytilinum TaxID=390894 RepID=A0A6A6R892_9PEZI|nr:hypothetical protein BU16DRAFT_557152 [Lophium mytilinum]
MPPPNYRAAPQWTPFNCQLCNKTYTRQNDYDNHLSSYEHTHAQNRANPKKLTDPRAGDEAARAERRQKKEQARIKALVKAPVVTSSGSGFTKIQDLAKQAEAKKNQVKGVDKDAPMAGVGFTRVHDFEKKAEVDKVNIGNVDRDVPMAGVEFTNVQDPVKQVEAEKIKTEGVDKVAPTVGVGFTKIQGLGKKTADVKAANKDGPKAGFFKIHMPAIQSGTREGAQEKGSLEKPDKHKEEMARKLSNDTEESNTSAVAARESDKRTDTVRTEEDGNASENDDFGYEYYDPRYPTECEDGCECRSAKMKT